MNRIVARLASGMLALSGLLFLGSLGWNLWFEMGQPAAYAEMDISAIVMAITSTPTERIEAASPFFTRDTPSPTPTHPPPFRVTPMEEALPMTRAHLTPTPTPEPPSPVPPQPSPTSSPIPSTPTPLPPSPAATNPQPASDPPTRIVAPAIHLDVRVVPMGWKTMTRDGQRVSEWVVPSGTAGWHINSALPGHPGNTVVSGHNNVEGKVFRYVSELEPGDKIYLYVDDQAYTYTVSEKHILKEAGMPTSVRLQNAKWIMSTDDVRLTLVTCWPYQWPGNTHRVIVVAKP